MKILRVISEKPLPFGCVLREQEEQSPAFVFEAIGEGAEGIAAEMQAAIDTAPPKVVVTVGYNATGHYIGNERASRYICEERGIAPELARPTDRVCSVGFCEKEQKWYGWSHRAMYGFGIGSVIKRGDCGYQAPTAEAFGQRMLEFFCDNEKEYLNRSHRPSVNADGVRGVMIEAIYSTAIPNKALHGQKYQSFWPYPESFGRGEWVVETLEDARQAACDFSDDVG